VIVRHPVARLEVDGRRLTSAEAAVGAVEIRLTLGGEHDSARVTLWSRSKLAGAAPEARAAIALGERDDPVEVWGGTLAMTEAGDRHVVLEGLSHTASLSRSRVTRTWQDQTVADIVRDLAGDAEIDEVDATLQLPWFAADARRTVWSYLRELAEMVGADVASNASGAVRFVPSSAAGEEHTLRFGAELLRWKLAERPSAPARGARALGAASEAGAQQWHWLLADSGSNAGGAPLSGAVRTKDAADLVAQARSDRAARRSHRASVLAVGSADLRPGDVVKLQDVPGAATERWRVTAVVHRLDGRFGFTTSLALEGAAA
jgi:prophage tail gpP-like protein